MMEYLGPLLAGVTGLAIAGLTAYLGVKAAERLGLSPVQQQYAEVLAALAETRKERIAEMEAEFVQCKERLEAALKRERAREKHVQDLEQDVFDLRADLRELRRELGRPEKGAPT